MNSVVFQRSRLLHALGERGSQGITTIYARDKLDCMHPATRIMEQRQVGHNVMSVWRTTENAQGRRHRNARYVLMSGGATARQVFQ